MSTVTERFVFRSATTAKGHSIPHFVMLAIGSSKHNSATHPQRAAAILRWVLDHSDREWKIRLDWLTGLFIYSHQATGRTAANLPCELFAYSLIIGPFHLFPNLPVRITKACERTQDFRIEELHRWAVNHVCLLDNWLMASRFRTVETDFGVCSIAERLGLRVAAAAKCVLARRGKLFPLDPFGGFTVAVDADSLN